jgi:hypothetical protein
MPRATKMVFPVCRFEILISLMRGEILMGRMKQKRREDGTKTYHHRYKHRICIIRSGIHQPGQEKAEYENQICPFRVDVFRKVTFRPLCP